MSERLRMPQGPSDYITCEELIAFLFAYLEGGLSAEEEREFQRHLEVCPACVAYLATYREAIRLGRGALAAASERPPELEAELVEAVLAARRRDSSG